MDSTDISWTFHPKIAEYTFLLRKHGIFSRTDHMLGHKVSFSKFKKNEIILGIFSNHSTIRIEINYKKKKTTVKNTNM